MSAIFIHSSLSLSPSPGLYNDSHTHQHPHTFTYGYEVMFSVCLVVHALYENCWSRAIYILYTIAVILGSSHLSILYNNVSHIYLIHFCGRLEQRHFPKFIYSQSMLWQSRPCWPLITLNPFNIYYQFLQRRGYASTTFSHRCQFFNNK